MVMWAVVRSRVVETQDLIEFADEKDLTDWVKNHGEEGDFVYEVQSKNKIEIKCIKTANLCWMPCP